MSATTTSTSIAVTNISSLLEEVWWSQPPRGELPLALLLALALVLVSILILDATTTSTSTSSTSITSSTSTTSILLEEVWWFQPPGVSCHSGRSIGSSRIAA